MNLKEVKIKTKKGEQYMRFNWHGRDMIVGRYWFHNCVQCQYITINGKKYIRRNERLYLWEKWYNDKFVCDLNSNEELKKLKKKLEEVGELERESYNENNGMYDNYGNGYGDDVGWDCDCY